MTFVPTKQMELQELTYLTEAQELVRRVAAKYIGALNNPVTKQQMNDDINQVLRTLHCRYPKQAACTPVNITIR